MKDVSDPLLVSRTGSAGRACAGLAVVVGVAVLFGWAVGNETLKSIVPGIVAMNPVTAVCFILCGLALLIWWPGTAGPQRWLPVCLATVVGICGLIRLGGYLFGWTLPVDQWIFPTRLDVGSGLPNRMAPNTAFNFVLLGPAIASLMLHRVRRAQFLALGAGLTAFAALLGYLLSVTSLKQVAGFIPMALHTAVLFQVLAVAVLCARPTDGLMGLVTSRGPGGRMIRSLLPVLMLAPPVLGWLRLQGELAGLYGAPFGVALFVVAMVVMGLGLTWVNARAVDRSDQERRRAEEITLRLAQFDGLTGLPNRLLFEDRLRQALARAQRNRGQAAILFLDLDGFKEVNDGFGHEAGDQVLKEAARRIEAAVRTVDTAARRGGDEFTVVLEQVRGEAEVLMVARRLVQELSKTYVVGGKEARLSASIGVSLFPRDGQAAGELLSLADAAMYRAKRAGEKQVAFHDSASSPVEAAASSAR